MEENKKLKNKTTYLTALLVFVVLLYMGISYVSNIDNAEISMDERRESFISQKNDIIGELIAEGEYACCLEKPCTYCIEKTPGHGEGASCHCLDDVINGVHPCGECIGEIMEGHGNKFLAKYFAVSIAEEVGEIHLDTIKQIISEKYGISISEQL